MSTTYRHTNIVSRNWRALADFYEGVFDCEFVPPERDLSGEWLSRGTGVTDAAFRGVHLRLPGSDATLEIYEYSRSEPKEAPAANRLGYGHLAFEVDDVEARLDEVLRHGGGSLGEVVVRDVPGVGRLTFVYATDPEGNVIELQSWLRTDAR